MRARDGDHHLEIESEINRLTRELLARQLDSRQPPPAIIRAYKLIIEQEYRRLDELRRR